MQKIMLYNKLIIILYMFGALCAHHLEIKFVLYSICYHHKSKWPSGEEIERGLCTGRLSTVVTIPDAL